MTMHSRQEKKSAMAITTLDEKAALIIFDQQNYDGALDVGPYRRTDIPSVMRSSRWGMRGSWRVSSCHRKLASGRIFVGLDVFAQLACDLAGVKQGSDRVDDAVVLGIVEVGAGRGVEHVG